MKWNKKEIGFIFPQKWGRANRPRNVIPEQYKKLELKEAILVGFYKREREL